MGSSMPWVRTPGTHVASSSCLGRASTSYCYQVSTIYTQSISVELSIIDFGDLQWWPSASSGLRGESGNPVRHFGMHQYIRLTVRIVLIPKRTPSRGDCDLEANTRPIDDDSGACPKSQNEDVSSQALNSMENPEEQRYRSTTTRHHVMVIDE